MNRQVYIHGHLIIDDKKQYLDGAIMVVDHKITAILNDSFHDFKGFEVIDLKKAIVFFKPYEIIEEKDYLQIANKQYPISNSLNNIKEPTFVYGDHLIADIKDFSNILGIYNLFNQTGDLSFNKPNLTNYAFFHNTLITIKPSTINLDILKMLFSVVDINNVIILGDYQKELKYLYECKIDFNDIACLIKNQGLLVNENMTISKNNAFRLMAFSEEMEYIKTYEY